MKMFKKVGITLGSLSGLIACTALVGCGSEVVSTSNTGSNAEVETKLSGNLTFNGSTSMAELVQAMGEGFTSINPEVKVDKSGSGSGEAATAVSNGTALIGDLSRELKAEERAEDFDIRTVAIDGIALVVNKDNPVKNLTSAQVTDIFSGKVNKWSQLGASDTKINVIGRESSSGTRDGFESIFNLKDKCIYSSELTSTGAVKAKVSSDPAAIGYVSLGSVDSSINALSIDGVVANEENIKKDTYKAYRPFIQISKKNSDDPLIEAWFKFLYSEEGKSIIRECKLIPTDENGQVAE